MFVYAVDSDHGRLEVGYGLEGSITDLVAKTIIKKMHPELKKGNYYNAFDYLLSSITTIRVYQAKPVHKNHLRLIIMILLFGIPFIWGFFSKGDGNNFIDGDSGGGGGSSGGGFGGGDSGGGGASF